MVSRTAPAATPAVSAKNALFKNANLSMAPAGAAPGGDSAAAKPTQQADTAPKAVKSATKLVRDSFTMPRDDYALIATLKQRSLDAGRATKKSELLRAGLHALAALKSTSLQRALTQLTPLKAGRPKKPA